LAGLEPVPTGATTEELGATYGGGAGAEELATQELEETGAQTLLEETGAQTLLEETGAQTLLEETGAQTELVGTALEDSTQLEDVYAGGAGAEELETGAQTEEDEGAAQVCSAGLVQAAGVVGATSSVQVSGGGGP